MPVLARAWQMLLKGLDDVRLAPSPLLAAEMVLVRLAYAADLPPPSELVRRLADGAPPKRPGAPAAPPLVGRTPGSIAAVPEAPAAPASFAEAVALFERFGEPMLHGWLYQAAQLVHFEPGRIELRLGAGDAAGPARAGGRGARSLDRAAVAGQLSPTTAGRLNRRSRSRRRRRGAGSSMRSRRTLASSRFCSIFPVRPWSTCARPLPAERASPTTEKS